MIKALIKHVQPILPHLLALSDKKGAVTFDYDKEADVLYISFQHPQNADDTEIVSDDILLRKKGGSLVGLTILHASTYR